MTLETLAACAGIVGISLVGIVGWVSRIPQRLWRRHRIKKFLVERRTRWPSEGFDAITNSRRTAHEIGVELGLTAEQVYDAAKDCNELDRSPGPGGTIWFWAKRSKSI